MLTHFTSQGRVFRDQLLSELNPAEQYDINIAMVTTLARLHSIDWRVIGLDNFGGKGATS